MLGIVVLALGALPSSDTAHLLKDLEIRIPQRRGRFNSQNGSERHCDRATFVQEHLRVFQTLVLPPKSAVGCFAWARVFQYLVISQAQVAPSFHSWWCCQVGHLFYCLGSFSFSTFSFPYFEILPLRERSASGFPPSLLVFSVTLLPTPNKCF